MISTLFTFLKTRLSTLPVAVILVACAVYPAYAQTAGSLEIERGRSMLRTIKSDIQKNYYDPKFRGIDIEAVFKDADEAIKKADSNGQIFGLIARVLINFDDSHLFFLPPPRNARVEYGWIGQMIGDNCYVVAVKPHSDAEAQGLKEGDQIHLYDGMKPNRKEYWKIQYLLNVLRPKGGLRLVVQSPGAEPRQLDVKAKVEQLQRLTDLTDMDEIMRLAVEEERDARLNRHRYMEMGQEVFIWKMPQFDLPKEKVAEMIDKFRKKQSVILDLRGNGGGYEDTLLRLLGGFFETDVKVGDIKGRKEAKPITVKSVGNNAFKGKLVVLIDSDSGSSSELFARVVQLEKRGVVLGDQSAGAVMRARHYPHTVGTGIGTFYGASVTEADIVMTDNNSLEGVGVTPDELLLPSQADLAAGRDPVLARAFELVGVKISPEKARALFPTEWRKP